MEQRQVIRHRLVAGSAVSAVTDDGSASLADAQREVARHRILGAARTVIAARGLDTRIEDVADAAAVSRRTVFRYFPTRMALLAAALRDSLQRYREHVPALDVDGDVEEWLSRALVEIHALNNRSGRVYLQLALESEMPPELAAVYEERRHMRVALVNEFTTAAFSAMGGSGEPPEWLFDAYAVHLSPFATQALVADFERTPEQSGRAAAQVLSAATRVAATAGTPAGVARRSSR